MSKLGDTTHGFPYLSAGQRVIDERTAMCTGRLQSVLAKDMLKVVLLGVDGLVTEANRKERRASERAMCLSRPLPLDHAKRHEE